MKSLVMWAYEMRKDLVAPTVEDDPKDDDPDIAEPITEDVMASTTVPLLGNLNSLHPAGSNPDTHRTDS